MGYRGISVSGYPNMGCRGIKSGLQGVILYPASQNRTLFERLSGAYPLSAHIIPLQPIRDPLSAHYSGFNLGLRE